MNWTCKYGPICLFGILASVVTYRIIKNYYFYLHVVASQNGLFVQWKLIYFSSFLYRCFYIVSVFVISRFNMTRTVNGDIELLNWHERFLLQLKVEDSVLSPFHKKGVHKSALLIKHCTENQSFLMRLQINLSSWPEGYHFSNIFWMFLSVFSRKYVRQSTNNKCFVSSNNIFKNNQFISNIIKTRQSMFHNEIKAYHR